MWFSTALPKFNNINQKNKNEKSTQESRATTAATATATAQDINSNNNKQRERAVVVVTSPPPSPPQIDRRDGVPECLFIVRNDSSNDSNHSNSCRSSTTKPQIAIPDDDDDDDDDDEMSMDNSSNGTEDPAAVVDEQIHFYNTPSPSSELGEQQQQQQQQHDDDDDDDDEDAFDETTKKENFDGVRSPRRVRMNSREIPRTYSGLYGDEDLLPFECQRQQRGTITSQSIWFLLFFYVTVVAGVQLVVSPSLLLNHHEDWVWTATNAIHLAVTVPYIHWLKGSIFDPQGEMNALTIWEQLEARGSDSKHVRQLLLIAPTLLCYAACHLSGYRVVICGVNLIFWSIAILAKLPFMNGVRIFGINRTVGIDDTEDNEDEIKNKKKVL